MKKIRFVISLVLAMVTIAALFSFSAAADNDVVQSTITDYYRPQYYLYTSYGYFVIEANTVVGYNNITVGEPVKAVQAGLTDVNAARPEYDCDPKGVDSLFGANTYNAIYKFQRAIHAVFPEVAVDGYAGNQTWYFLELFCS